jgi:CMP-N-acetylneuraminic acid synthetase
MKILGIIPASKGSKRLPNKNILHFDGKPLVEHIINTARKSNLINKLVVSTDCTEILELVKEYDEVVGIKRLDALANDTSPAID